MSEQGDILKVSGIAYPVMVVSNGFFNSSGRIIACPVVRSAEEGPLHIKPKDSPVEGCVLCEQPHYLDLSTRRWSKVGSISLFDIMNISDALMGIFDYQAL